jgi:hypothetical protein
MLTLRQRIQREIAHYEREIEVWERHQPIVATDRYDISVSDYRGRIAAFRWVLVELDKMSSS